MNKTDLLSLVENHLVNDISINDILDELGNYICLLTRENADLIENCISNDPNYPDIMAPVIRRLINYPNQYSIQEINALLTQDILEDFVWKVAIVNSIQGKKPSVKRYIADYILNEGISFYEQLRDGNLSIVEEMENYVYVRGGRVRHECSWCSKVCKFLHDYLFDNDAYYIYDNNVKNRLNDYRHYYNLPATSKRSINVGNNEHWYENLCESLDELRHSLSDELGRFEIDHILWGFAKYKVELARKN